MTAHRRLIASLGAAWQKLIEPVGMAPEAAAQFARGLATHGVADVGPKTSRLSRFYKAVGVKEADDKVWRSHSRPVVVHGLPLHFTSSYAFSLAQGGYQITLDGYVLKTPARQPLTVPSKALARAIAAEWAWQARRVEPSTMPLMSLAATAIDQPQPRQVIEDTMVHYVSTDPVVCRVEPGELADKQAAALDPILQWVRGEIGATVEPSDSIFGVQLSPEDQAKFKKYLEGERKAGKSKCHGPGSSVADGEGM